MQLSLFPKKKNEETGRVDPTLTTALPLPLTLIPYPNPNPNPDLSCSVSIVVYAGHTANAGHGAHDALPC